MEASRPPQQLQNLEPGPSGVHAGTESLGMGLVRVTVTSPGPPETLMEQDSILIFWSVSKDLR